MKIVIALKQVPARDSVLRVDPSARWIDEDDLTFEINEPDAYALEEGLELKARHGGEVVVLCAGPARALRAIREALAKGADRAIHVEHDGLAALDPFQVAGLLAGAVRPEAPDLILTGLQSDDLGYGQTGVILAERLGFPHSTIVMGVEKIASGIRVKRELENGWFQHVEMALPALVTVQSGIKRLRYATLMGIKQAKSKEIRRVTGPDAGPETGGARIEVRRVYAPVRAKHAQLFSGNPKEAAAKLVERLRREARVL
jgi:electron transfer flavoprotein beta subunit